MMIHPPLPPQPHAQPHAYHLASLQPPPSSSLLPALPSHPQHQFASPSNYSSYASLPVYQPQQAMNASPSTQSLLSTTSSHTTNANIQPHPPSSSQQPNRKPFSFLRLKSFSFHTSTVLRKIEARITSHPLEAQNYLDLSEEYRLLGARKAYTKLLEYCHTLFPYDTRFRLLLQQYAPTRPKTPVAPEPLVAMQRNRTYDYKWRHRGGVAEEELRMKEEQERREKEWKEGQEIALILPAYFNGVAPPGVDDETDAGADAAAARNETEDVEVVINRKGTNENGQKQPVMTATLSSQQPSASAETTAQPPPPQRTTDLAPPSRPSPDVPQSSAKMQAQSPQQPQTVPKQEEESKTVSSAAASVTEVAPSTIMPSRHQPSIDNTPNNGVTPTTTSPNSSSSSSSGARKLLSPSSEQRRRESSKSGGFITPNGLIGTAAADGGRKSSSPPSSKPGVHLHHNKRSSIELLDFLRNMTPSEREAYEKTKEEENERRWKEEERKEMEEEERRKREEVEEEERMQKRREEMQAK